MCRLLGYVTTHPTSVVDVLGREDFDTFTALTEVHGDGWGMAWHRSLDDATEATSSALNASIDPRYAKLADQALGCCGLVHLRWATGGLPVSPENTHPFTSDGYAFAHNGHVAPIDHLEAQLSAASRAKLVGDTDSERYFRLIMQCIDDVDDEPQGVTRALEILVREFPNSSLNALLLTPRRLFAIHINSRVDSPVEALRELFESDRGNAREPRDRVLRDGLPGHRRCRPRHLERGRCGGMDARPRRHRCDDRSRDPRNHAPAPGTARVAAIRWPPASENLDDETRAT